MCEAWDGQGEADGLGELLVLNLPTNGFDMYLATPILDVMRNVADNRGRALDHCVSHCTMRHPLFDAYLLLIQCLVTCCC